MSLPSSRFVRRYPWPDRKHVRVNGKRVYVGEVYVAIVDLHEEFPPRGFVNHNWDAESEYMFDMNYAHDPYFRLAVDSWKKKTT